MQLAIAECSESVNDALVAAVNALGGPKKVGPMLRPELPIEQAAGWLRDCLNPAKRDKLAFEQVILILRKARDAGYHGAISYILSDLGYAPTVPIEPKDEAAELTRQTTELLAAAERLTERLQRVQARMSVRGVA